MKSHGMLAMMDWHGSPLMMQNAARLYCVQAENCPRVDISFVNVFDGRSFGPLRKMPVDRAEGYRS